MFGVKNKYLFWHIYKGKLKPYLKHVKRGVYNMIDRFNLGVEETYTFMTDNQYVVVVALGKVNVVKDNQTVASLEYLETFSCPASSGSYTLINPSSTNNVDVLLVRYILV